MTAAYSYPFRQYDPIVGDDIALLLNRYLEGQRALEGAPAYLFDIVLLDGTLIGQIDLRIGTSHTLVTYAGQIGYGIDRPYRGNHYAVKACELIAPVARDHGMHELWITCNPDNQASVRTCERLGARYIETVKVPRWSELWRRGDREKLRYLWILPEPEPSGPRATD